MPIDDEDFFGYFTARNCLNERIFFDFLWGIVLLDCFGIQRVLFLLVVLDGAPLCI